MKKQTSAITRIPIEMPTPAPILVALDDVCSCWACGEANDEGAADVAATSDVDATGCIASGRAVEVDLIDVETCVCEDVDVLESLVGNGICVVAG